MADSGHGKHARVTAESGPVSLPLMPTVSAKRPRVLAPQSSAIKPAVSPVDLAYAIDQAKFSAREAVTAAARARNEVSTRLRTQSRLATRLTKQDRIDRLPFLAAGLVLNFALWMSTIYQIFDIQKHSSKRWLYEVLAWPVIFFLVSVVFLGLAVIFKNALALVNKESIYVFVIANATLCFFFVILYFRHTALPRYEKPIWDLRVDYNDSLILPAFAYLGGNDYQDAALANFVDVPVNCDFPKFEDATCPTLAFNNSQPTVNVSSGAYGLFDAYIFDPRKLEPGNRTVKHLSDRVRLQVTMNYNRSYLISKYTTSLAQAPYIFAVLYDARISLADALHCGLIAVTDIPALGSNTFTITAETITDKLNIVQPLDDKPRCRKFYQDTLSLERPPYVSYSFHLSSEPISDISVCDTSIDGSNSCISQVLLRFGTWVVSSMESKPGIELTDILINEGAIVGAIQFFMWFLGIFSM